MLQQHEGRVRVDLGTGDGHYVLRTARQEPGWLHVGIDPAATAMADARRAMRQQLGNALFVRASLESLPSELDACAARVTVLLPWGTLLRAILAPDVDALARIRRLCQPGALLRAVIAFDARRDGHEWHRLGLDGGGLSAGQIDAGYAAAGFELGSVRRCDRHELRGLGTTWAKRLASAPGRAAWTLEARAGQSQPARATKDREA